MPYTRQHPNQVKLRRLDRGWSQAELAQRAAISRAAVSAIEVNRLVPSVAAAMSLALALKCTVEDLFGHETTKATTDAVWAWSPSQNPCRYWHATLGARTLLYPVESTPAGEIEHDGMCQDGVLSVRSRVSADQTLVL